MIQYETEESFQQIYELFSIGRIQYIVIVYIYIEPNILHSLRDLLLNNLSFRTYMSIVYMSLL